MKYTTALIYGLIILLSSCSKWEIQEEALPDISDLSPQSISTHLPLVLIQCDPEQFDHMYENFGQDLTIPARVSLFNKSTEEPPLEHRAQVQLKGGLSKSKDLKSLGIIFDEMLDNQKHPWIAKDQMLPGHSLRYVKSLRLRNSGNDLEETFIKDLAYTQLAIQAGLNLELMYYDKPVHVFVNKQYLGLLNLRSESNELGIGPLIGEPIEDITVLKADGEKGNMKFRYGNSDWAGVLINAIKEEDTKYIWQNIDQSNFIDYLIYEDYVENNDWPHNNVRMYSVREGKFRFVLYDLDRVARYPRNPILPELEFLKEDVAKIYRAMLKKEGFEQALRQRQEELYQRFSPGVFNAIVNELAREIEGELAYQIAKYGMPVNHFTWKYHINELKQNFKTRDARVRKFYGIK